MSYVDVVILGHLAKQPCHGYALRRQVEAATGFGLHNNALYPALRRFEEAGAVTKTAQPQPGGRLPRLVYQITEAGRELLHDRLAGLPAAQAGDDAEFLARLGQFEDSNRAGGDPLLPGFRPASRHPAHPCYRDESGLPRTGLTRPCPPGDRGQESVFGQIS